MSTRDDYIAAIGRFVHGEFPLGEADKILAIGRAVKEHSKHKPRIVVEDVDGDGGFDYPVSGLEAWDDEFSSVKSIEYPVNDDDETPDMLHDSEWRIYRKPSGQVIRFLEDRPTASESIRVTYTAMHACTDSTCTVAGFDEEAVQALAASVFCEMLATYYASNQDSTIQADSVDHTSKSRDFAARAARYRKLYADHMGIKDGQTKAASVTGDQDSTPSWGEDHMTHPRKYR